MENETKIMGIKNTDDSICVITHIHNSILTVLC